MAEITAQKIKELRERTQAGMSDCKSALVEAEGDMEKAVEVILKKGIVKAAARAGRVAAEGEVRTHVTADGKRGTIVEVNCQTDFVARGDDFRGFVGQVLEVASKLPKGADLSAAKLGDKTVEEARQAMVGKTGENTIVRRWDMLDAPKTGFVHAYVHMGGKLGVLVAVEAPADKVSDPVLRNFADGVAMQAVSMGALAVDQAGLAKADIDKQREILQAQFGEEQQALAPEKRKPEAMWSKIVDGKVAKWVSESTLLGQEWVLEAGQGTVDKVRAEVGKKIGGDVKITSFVRFGLGDGIEKKTDDLAAEVAKMTGN